MRLHIIHAVIGLLLAPVISALPSPGQGLIYSRSADWVVGQTVNTTSGPVLGHPASNNTDVSEYLGIPYAKPPVGDLRWQRPVAYNGTIPINGSSFGFACMQAHPSLKAEHSLGVFYNLTRGGYYVSPDILLPEHPQSEDCLTLNVWTRPQQGEASKAVMVWIHGGSFTGGSSSEEWFHGQFMAEEQDLVVVSINYRLNIFGFPGNPTSDFNLGILDQRLAMEWVRDNIANFGGDPDRIVMYGQSAGAGSIDLQSYAYAHDPIASAYVLQSGTAWSFGLQTQEAAADLWNLTAKHVGCNNGTVKADKIFSCMMKVSSTKLMKYLPPIRYGYTPGLPYGPIIDEKLVFENYQNRTPAARPMLIGNTNDESGMSKLVTPKWSRLPSWYWPVQNVYVFTCPAGQRAAINVGKGNPTWRYRWFGSFPNVLLPWSSFNGSWHGSELPTIFNTEPQWYTANTERETAIGKYIRGAWAAFAKDPVHGLHNYDEWPNYKRNGTTLIRLAYGNKNAQNNDTRVGINLGSSLEYDDDC